MAERTEISWTDATFNPWIGCTKVSPGCDHCYAEAQDKFRHWTPAGWGSGQPRKRTSEDTWDKPGKWNDEPFYECSACGWRGGAKEASAESMGTDFAVITCPRNCDGVLRLTRRRVFCASLADVFDNEVPVAWRADLFFLIEQTPNLDWLLLTKRIGNVQRMVQEASDYLVPVHRRLAWPLPNVWLGATIVNQEEADRDIPKLLATPARVRFLSMEPLLGPVDLARVHAIPHNAPVNVLKPQGCAQHAPGHCFGDCHWRWRGVNWVIVGGESGPHARPMHPDWARSLRDQCAAAGVPLHFKQWGEWGPLEDHGPFPAERPMREVRIFVEEVGGLVRVAGPSVVRIGKKAAGRLLDGVEHNGFPEVG